MRFLFTLILGLLFTPLSGSPQIYEPVNWEFSKKQISENTYELTFVADIDEGWAIYSNDIYNNGVDCDVEICPIPVSFEFNESKGLFNFMGEVFEEDRNKKVSQDPIFLMEVTKFEKQAVFRQTIEIISQDFKVTGYLTFMTCDDTKCLPPTDVEFSFNFGEPKEDNVTTSQSKEDISKNNMLLYGFLPEDIVEQEANCNSVKSTVVKDKDRSLFNIFLLGLIGGFLALLTPCVFPMIPLTVSFFTKKNENENGIYNAVLYGLFIFLVYLALSIPFHLLDSVNPDILNDISTNVSLNIFFFLIFLVLHFPFLVFTN